MLNFDNGENKLILKEIHETHPFVMYSPNIIKASRGFSACDFMLLLEIGLRLKYDSGSFMLKNDSSLQKKLNRDSEELALSIMKLLKADVISVIDEKRNIYQANPVILWKGSMQTLLDKHNELLNLTTFSLKEKYQCADELTAKRIIEVIKKTQEELHPQLLEKNLMDSLELEGEEWVNVHNDECNFISNKGRMKFSQSPGGKERIRKIEYGKVNIKGKYYNVKDLVKEHFSE